MPLPASPLKSEAAGREPTHLKTGPNLGASPAGSAFTAGPPAHPMDHPNPGTTAAKGGSLPGSPPHPARSCVQARCGRPRPAAGRPTNASHFEAVVTETPRLLATADGESVGFSPSGTGRVGRVVYGNGMDSRLRAALAADGDTPVSLAT